MRRRGEPPCCRKCRFYTECVVDRNRAVCPVKPNSDECMHNHHLHLCVAEKCRKRAVRREDKHQTYVFGMGGARG